MYIKCDLWVLLAPYDLGPMANGEEHPFVPLAQFAQSALTILSERRQID
jgi:hypothetical protein